jgi:hypothetical protein
MVQTTKRAYQGEPAYKDHITGGILGQEAVWALQLLCDERGSEYNRAALRGKTLSGDSHIGCWINRRSYRDCLKKIYLVIYFAHRAVSFLRLELK